jgi:hypothetical protein
VYIEGHRIVRLDPYDPISVSYGAKIGSEPAGREHPGMLKLQLLPGHDGTIVEPISRIGYMAGGKAAWWKDEEMTDTLTRNAVSFIERSAGHPFFLYFATNNIHQPRWPNPRFCGTRCDSIQEFDASVGAVLSALDRLQLTDKTSVIVSSIMAES